MAEVFNPYHVWLGIPPQELPANFYRLLALPLLESDPDVIDNAADQRTAHLRTFQSGKHGKEAERLLNEVAAARVCLLDPKKKAAYDQRVRAWLAAQQAQAASAAGGAAPQQAAQQPSASDWDDLLGDVADTPRKSVGSRQGAVGRKQKAKQRPVAIFAVAGVLLAAVAGIGIYALTSGSADGTLALDWPADQRTGATLTIDGAPATIPPSGAVEFPSPPGEHRLAATRPLYQPWSRAVTVASGERQAVAMAWKPKAVVALDWPLKDRQGADVKVDGQIQTLSDHEPLELLVEPGQHTIRILRPGVEPFQTGVQVALDGRRTVAIAPAAVDTTLLVQWPVADRTGGHLVIDGAEPTLAKSSPETLEFTLKTGRHTIQITRPGFQPIAQTVDVAAADNKPLVPTWTPEVATNTQPATPDVAVTPESPQGTDARAAKKRPIPSADEQAKIAKQLDELFKPTHSAADAAKASEFYELADKAQSPAERYMLLARGAELAAGAGDVALAFSGVDLLAAEYEIEPFDAKQKLLEKGVAAATTADQFTALITAAEPLLDQAIAADQYAAAMAIAATASKALGKRPVDAQLRKDTDDLLARRRRDIRILEPLYAAAQKAQKTLEASPDDAEANLTVGRWYCLYKNDWPRGLPLLAKGSDEKLKALAQAELKPPATTDEQVQAADAWWDASPKEIAFVRDAIRLHAGDIYTAALPGLSSPLAKIKIDKRLAEIAKLQRPGMPVVGAVPSGPQKLPRGQWVDVLRLVDTNRDAIKGTWTRDGAEISCGAAAVARVEIPVAIDGGYDLEVQFTRTAGSEGVNAIIPVGESQCAAVLSAFTGSSSGLEMVAGHNAGARENPTAMRLAHLENGHRYTLAISVKLLSRDRASIDVSLDGKPYLPHWQGDPSSLTVNPDWSLRRPTLIGLGAFQNRVVFHSARLRMISGQATSDAAAADIPHPTKPPPPAKPVALPRGQWADVLKLVDTSRDAVKGTWSRNGAEITSDRTWQARVEIPVDIDGSYDLEAEFTRTDGIDDVDTVIPVDSQQCNVVLSGWNGKASGLALVDGRTPEHDDNPTSTQPGTLENNHRYRLLISVRVPKPGLASVDVTLDGKHYLPHWEGKSAALKLDDAWALRHPKMIGLASFANLVTFHSVRLRMISGQATSDAAPARIDGTPLGSGESLPEASRKFIKLVDLKPVSAEVGWGEFLVNRAGGDGEAPLIARDFKMCDEYIFAHAPSRVSYAVPPESRSFSATAYCVANRSVRFEIVCDGQSLYRSESGGVVPIKVELPRGAQKLELVAAAAAADRANAHSFWCCPRFYSSADATGKFQRLTDMTPTATEVGYYSLTVNKLPDPVVTPPLDAASAVPCDEFLFAHANSRIRYEVPDGAVRFTGIGFCQRRGLLTYKVVCDGAVLYESQPTGIAAIDVAIPQGAHTLDLAINFTHHHDGAHSYWCYPRFYFAAKSPSPPAKSGTLLLHQWLDVLALVDPARDAVNGAWSRSGAEISGDAANPQLLNLPVTIDGDYDLELEFTRGRGTRGVEALFPVGSRHCVTILGTLAEDGRGIINGLELVAGAKFSQPENPTYVNRELLQDSRRHRQTISVRLLPENRASIDVSLDGQPCWPKWTGSVSALDVRGEWTKPGPQHAGLRVETGNRVVYHSARLRMLSGQATPDATAAIGAKPIGN